MKTVAFIQARMASTRLPGKVLMNLAGKPVLARVVERVRASSRVDEVVVLTSIFPQDLAIVHWCAANRLRVFCGAEQDVLDRFYQAARLLSTYDTIVRITADCPLMDPKVVDLVVDEFASRQVDYLSNSTNGTWPDGLDVEVFNSNALTAAWQHARLPSEREHVTPYIYKHPELFRLAVLDHAPSLQGLRWTLDQPEDYEFLSWIYKEMSARGSDLFGMEQVLALLNKQPEKQVINKFISRNEGYAKSLVLDNQVREATMGRGQDLYRRAKKLIPGGTQLLSKRPELFAPDQWPAYYKSARGCMVTDLDGRQYVDMSYMGIGACILGYADEDVNRAVNEAVQQGSMCTLNAPEEVELAELMLQLHPWADMVRYARTGGEASAVAIRIARAATGREKILFCGYHGWHDWYLAANLADNSALDGHLLPGLSPNGVPRYLLESSFPFHYNNTDRFLELIQKYGREVAAVIMEPVRNHEPEPGFFNTIRRICSEHSIALIVDEVSAGFRQNLGGAHLAVGLEPDIAVFAKGISNGFPMAVILGRESYMEAAQKSFISSTYWTERIGPVAALATLSKIVACDVPSHLINMGTEVQDGWRRLAKSHGLEIHVGGIAALSHFSFVGAKNPLACKTLFTQEMLRLGYLATTAFYPCYAHSAEIVTGYISACNAVFAQIAAADQEGRVMELLHGPVCHGGFQRLT